jgi:hypothetical protein
LIRTGQVLLGLVVGLAVTEAVFWWRDDGAFPHLNVYRADATLGVRLVPGREQRLAFGGNPVTGAPTCRRRSPGATRSSSSATRRCSASASRRARPSARGSARSSARARWW